MALEWNDLFLDQLNTTQLVRVFVRLVLAVVLGGIVGLERQREKRPAGLRTHMLVALGAALFTLIGVEAQMDTSDLSRVIQGIAAGIGFLGAGTILKLSEEHKIQGLTTSATIWLTAAVGMAIGAGWLWPALVSVAFAWTILLLFQRIDQWLK